ncbi:hypothetical protein F443_22866 [Phytophthora nicotianae P1569]|uniref:Uncharacterized protein n=1 Tax=Phytophthora nicotianae P1569 TaxID=1317065 RepID=V9DSZ3_PHYNI|nr:hypothetical protein F443_22866 [Phytophthora nicotianae P1569]
MGLRSPPNEDQAVRPPAEASVSQPNKDVRKGN